jgi:glucose-6-phosphate 1-dehydrogenase
MEEFHPVVPPCTLVIFGASGDLTERKLIPALYSLDCEHLLPPGFRVLGTARTDYTNESFRQHLKEGVAKFGRLKPELWDGFAEKLFYMPGSYDNPSSFNQLRDWVQELGGWHGNYLFYLAVPPVVYYPIIQGLGKVGLNKSPDGWVRVIVEKPFGTDLKSARALNAEIHKFFDEDQVYRIDHYLGKETVQNLLAFRFANYLFESVWERNYIDHVQISALEDVDVGDRAGYYDQAGVVRDMLQNHLLQLLALTAMDPPIHVNAKFLRDEKVEVLEAVRPMRKSNGVWGQYEGYHEEQDVPPDSTTPTYIALKVFVDNWRWHGVPFYLRTGKALKRKSTEIMLQFKPVPHVLFREKSGEPQPNRLSICIQPDEGMHLRFELKVPGAEVRIEPVSMDFHYNEIFGNRSLPEAYERLLLDAMQGDASLFTRSDEIERAWELVAPLLDAFKGENQPKLHQYPKGGWGPAEADHWMEQQGHAWAICCDHSEGKPEE